MLMIGKQLTVEQRLNKAVIDIMANDKYVALSGVLMIGSKTVCDKTKTAKTNGRDEVYGRKFVEDLTDAELRFLVLHECYHKLYRHLTTWQHLYKEDASRANKACDYVINIKLADDNKDKFAVMPSMGLLDEKYRGMDSAQVYALLPESGDDEDGDEGMDDHDWDDAQEMDEEERKQLERDIDSAVRQGALAAGKMGSGGARAFDDLLQPKVNWREILREFISSVCTGNDYSTWRKPNRRYLGAGHYLPSGISESIGELVIAIDTSGSIGREELSVFMQEVTGICLSVHPERVRVLYWDTQVCREEVYKQDELGNLVKSTKPAGGGGTAVSCVPDYMAAKGIKPQAVVVFTDGYLGNDWGKGKWTVPVLWCIDGNDSARPPMGKYVHIK
jgi:predicted metal-dependent peptidase